MHGAHATDAAMMMTLLQVALGGAIGACLRFGVVQAMLRVPGPGFPLGVLTVNVAGSFLMGVVVVLVLQRDIAWLNPLVAVGILGGFTTFSTFSLEAFTLLERGHVLAAGSYVALSVVLSLAALALGVALARGVLA
jgi:CrcB protein